MQMATQVVLSIGLRPILPAFIILTVSAMSKTIVIAKHFGINRGFLLVRLKSRKRKFLILTNFVSLTTTNVKK